MRLLDGNIPQEGRVEVCKNNTWSTVCDEGWSSTDARVACRQLGYSAVGMYNVYYRSTQVCLCY